jgi:hypothetical protein
MIHAVVYMAGRLGIGAVCIVFVCHEKTKSTKRGTGLFPHPQSSIHDNQDRWKAKPLIHAVIYNNSVFSISLLPVSVKSLYVELLKVFPHRLILI